MKKSEFWTFLRTQSRRSYTVAKGGFETWDRPEKCKMSHQSQVQVLKNQYYWDTEYVSFCNERQECSKNFSRDKQPRVNRSMLHNLRLGLEGSTMEKLVSGYNSQICRNKNSQLMLSVVKLYCMKFLSRKVDQITRRHNWVFQNRSSSALNSFYRKLGITQVMFPSK